MFAVPGESALKQSKSARAGLQLSVGRFYRWMTDARLGKFIHEYAAVYLCAGIENLLEEIALQCNGSTAAALDQSIARYLLLVLLLALALFLFLNVRDYKGTKFSYTKSRP